MGDLTDVKFKKGFPHGAPRVTVSESARAWILRLEGLDLPLRVLKQARQIPTRYLGTWAKAVLGEVGSKAAIKAKCYDCVAFETVTESVGECPSRNCPLWAYRPHQPKGRDK